MKAGSYLAIFLCVGAREQRVEDDYRLVQIPHEHPLEDKTRGWKTVMSVLLAHMWGSRVVLLSIGWRWRGYRTSIEIWMAYIQSASARSSGCFSFFLAPYLQVTIRGRGGVVLAAPAPGLGPPTPAGSVVQLFDGRGWALHGIKVPWEGMQTQAGLNVWNILNLQLIKCPALGLHGQSETV